MNNNNQPIQPQRARQSRVMPCPVCRAYYFRNYGRLCLHLLNPTNCFGRGLGRHPIPQVNGHVSESNIVPVRLPLRLLLMFAWLVWYLAYQAIVDPFLLFYEGILYWLLYRWLIRHFLYQRILRPVFLAIIQPIYLATVPCLHWADLQLVCAIEYGRLRSRLFLLRIYLGVIRPLGETVNFAVRGVFNLPERCLHICLQVIGAERAAAQATFRTVFGRFDWMIQKVESLNAIMFDIVFFPLDLPADGVPVWKRCFYYLFSAIHVCILVRICCFQSTALTNRI